MIRFIAFASSADVYKHSKSYNFFGIHKRNLRKTE